RRDWRSFQEREVSGSDLFRQFGVNYSFFLHRASIEVDARQQRLAPRNEGIRRGARCAQQAGDVLERGSTLFQRARRQPFSCAMKLPAVPRIQSFADAVNLSETNLGR